MEKPKQATVSLQAEKMAQWRKGYSKDVLERIARQEPLPVAMLKEHYAQCNAAMVERIAARGEIVSPKSKDGKWDYQLAMKQCTDARQVTIDLDFLMDVLTIHERTAGNIVRSGKVFLSLAETGSAIVEGHYQCGATGVAHKLRDADLPNIDENILRILTAISPYVRNIGESAARDRENAIDQAGRVRRILRINGLSNQVFSGFYTWENGENGPFYDWLEAPGNGIGKMLEESSVRLTRHSLAEGRNFDTQYAAITMMYDPYRLGRINDPRAIFDALVNEMFCVTFDFRRMEEGNVRNLSRTALGSVKYANFDQGGHVNGVGGVGGTHALGIIDTDEGIIERAKKYLLDTFKEIKNLTGNGKAIIPIKYDPQTGKAQFLED